MGYNNTILASQVEGLVTPSQGVDTPTLTPSLLTINSNSDNSFLNVGGNISIAGTMNLTVASGTSAFVQMTVPFTPTTILNKVISNDIDLTATQPTITVTVASGEIKINISNGLAGQSTPFNLYYNIMYA